MKEYIIHNREDWQAILDLVKNVIGVKPFVIKLTTDLKRTLKQNSLLHAVVTDCCKKTGKYTPEWWKKELKLKLGLKEVHFDIDDQPHVILISTRNYSREQMSAFCKKIVAHMKTDYEVDIILPGELQ